MKTELQNLKLEIENHCKTQIAAIDRLLKIEESRQSASISASKSPTVFRPHKKTSEIIEELIKTHTGVFSTSDIYLRLGEVIGKNPSINQARQISQVINKLRQRNPPEVKEVEKGRGSRSGKYKYIKP